MESKIRAYGPGLKGGVVNKPALFTVETNGELGLLVSSRQILAVTSLLSCLFSSGLA